MIFKPITKEGNKKRIMIYYVVSIIFISIGMLTGRPTWYIVGLLVLVLALFRKYWLMNRLKE